MKIFKSNISKKFTQYNNNVIYYKYNKNNNK